MRRAAIQANAAPMATTRSPSGANAGHPNVGGRTRQREQALLERWRDGARSRCAAATTPPAPASTRCSTQQLPPQPPARCAQRGAHGELGATHRRAHGEEARDVEARNQQHRGNRRAEHGEQPRRVAVQLLLEAEHLDELARGWCPDTPRRAPRAMPFERIVRLRDRRRLALRRPVAFRKWVPRFVFAGSSVSGTQALADPGGKSRPSGSTPTIVGVLAVDLHRLTDDVGARAELRAPERRPEHHHRRGARRGVGGHERATEHRLDAQHVDAARAVVSTPVIWRGMPPIVIATLVPACAASASNAVCRSRKSIVVRDGQRDPTLTPFRAARSRPGPADRTRGRGAATARPDTGGWRSPASARDPRASVADGGKREGGRLPERAQRVDGVLRQRVGVQADGEAGDVACVREQQSQRREASVGARRQLSRKTCAISRPNSSRNQPAASTRARR